MTGVILLTKLLTKINSDCGYQLLHIMKDVFSIVRKLYGFLVQCTQLIFEVVEIR